LTPRRDQESASRLGESLLENLYPEDEEEETEEDVEEDSNDDEDEED
tara:strand:+ start:449 stop:589 length:141 start_codon:yes stop_codon:yes gene_type:complete